MAKKKVTKAPQKPTNMKPILRIVGMGLFALSLLFLISHQTGILGEYVRKGYFSLFGVFSYIVPLFGFALLIYFHCPKIPKRMLRITIGLMIISIFVSALITIHSLTFTVFDPYLAQAMDLAERYSGTGLLGASTGFILQRLLGRVGSTVLLVLGIIVTFLITMEVTIDDLKLVTHSFLGLIRKVSDRKPNPKMMDEEVFIDSLNPTPLITNENEKKEISVIDYAKKPEQKKVVEKPLRKEEIESAQQMEMETFSSKEESPYHFPTIDLLDMHGDGQTTDEKQKIVEKAKKIETTLSNFGISCQVTQVNRGPTVTCFEMQPAPGVKVSRIVNLSDDIALSLAASDVRVVAPLPGKAAVGIEVPNDAKDVVGLREIIDSDAFEEQKSKLPFALGKTISGKPVVSSIEKMPHLLIAGATGSGKSVCINTLIMSILYRAKPDEVKLMLIDPKVVELSVYNHIPHLIVPVVTDAKKASGAMYWAVEEMERRYALFSKHRVRDLTAYNNKQQMDDTMEKLPFIVIVIDELADLMMVSAGEVENYIARLAQMARACGIHLIVATQRPSVDVITGTIKANIPSRISFQVSSQIDSRTILDMAGAEKLLGKGDMLFYPSGMSKPQRLQGAFVSDEEVERVVSIVKENNQVQYDAEVIESIEEKQQPQQPEEDTDPMLADAVDVVLLEGQASVSLLQRRMKVGYARAGRMIDEMESLGIVGKHEGSKPRKVLVSYNILKEEDDECSE